MKARSPSLIDRRVLDPLLVRVGALPGRAPLPKTPPEEEPVRFAKTPSAPPERRAEPPKSTAEAPESVAEAPELTPSVPDADTAPEEPVEVPGFGSEYSSFIRIQAPDTAPQALDISALMSEWRVPQIVIETPETGLEYPDIVLEAPEPTAEAPELTPAVPEPTAEAPEPVPAVPFTTLPEIPIPGEEAQPLESRLANLLSWTIDATAATAAFVADENGLPLANRESPEALLAAAALLSQSLDRLGTLVPSHAQGSAAIELEDDHVLQLVWVDSDRGKWAVGLVVADALGSEMIRTIRATLRRVVSK